MGNMTHLIRTTPWVFRWHGRPRRIFVSIRFILYITCVKSSNIYDSAFSLCFPGARIDLSVEDNVVALALAECPARLYAEMIISDIPGPSNLRSAHSTASRPPPPSPMGVPPIGLSAATPTRGEILAQLGTLSRKPQSAKRKKSSSIKKDRPISAKVQKLGASSSSPSTHVRKSKKDPGSESGGDGDSLLLNAELVAEAVSSILKDSDLKKSKTLPVDEALALSLQGVTSVSPCILSCLFPF